METSGAVHVHDVTKTFPGVRALDRVNLTIRSGEVLALVGENGAGKSTLMKILSGVYPQGSFEGRIDVDGKAMSFRSPLDAEKAGIAIIHQELAPFSDLTVAENIFVGHWPSHQGVITWRHLREEAKKWLDAVGATCSPDDQMRDLSVGMQQMVEIAKALSRSSRYLILDEPTSALTPREVEKLFQLIRRLKGEGKGLVYISHKMDELYEISDRFTVLRDGKTVHSATRAELPENALIAHMVGRSLTQLFPARPVRKLGDIILEAKDLEGRSENGKRLFGPVNFQLRKGEILGFSGLLGAGRTELVRSIYGDPGVRLSGEIQMNGKKISPRHPVDGLRNGIAYIPEDRKRESILPGRSLDENVSLARLSAAGLMKSLSPRAENILSGASLKRLRTKCTGPEQEIQNLSGGNQQKVIIARALQMEPDVLILDEPTRGVDVGAKFEIYEILFELAKAGKSLLVVSSELPELIALSDRICVLHEGEQMGVLEGAECTQVNIMRLAVGLGDV